MLFEGARAVTQAPLRLQFDVKGELREAAKECEAELFAARFGKTARKLGNARELGHAYERYESASRFSIVTDESGQVIAASRLIFPGPAGLKALHDIAVEPWKVNPKQATGTAGLDPAQTVDATSFAVRDGLGAQGVEASYALLYGLFGALEVNGIPSMVAVIDDPVRRMLRTLGLIFHRLPGTSPQPYFGSAASEPVYAHLSYLMTTQRALAPREHLAIARGIGLVGVDVPPPHELRLATRVIDLAHLAPAQLADQPT
jgi:hypothetical protein